MSSKPIEASPNWGNWSHSTTTEFRIQALLDAMTLEEKVQLLGGTGFATQALPRLGIPALTMTDGPLGVRWGKATAFPAGVAMGASFDPALVESIAGAIARDAKALGRYVLLGPCVNLHRTPFGGRNFESFGEDPLLASRLGAAYVHGIQNQGVIATVKHFALNEQEFERMTISAVADERTLRELHFPAFETAVANGVMSLMSSYNRVNGTYASENAWLLNTVLKGEWGFRGFVVSDWGATHSTVPSALNGLDLEMPQGDHFNESLVEAVRLGRVPEAMVDDKVRRILRPMFAIGLFDSPPAPTGRTDDASNRALALRAAEKSIVLLQNDGILPLSPGPNRRIAVIGPNAARARSGGGGSSQVEPFYKISPLAGLQNLNRSDLQIDFAPGVQMDSDLDPLPIEFLTVPDSDLPGVRATYFANTNLTGSPVLTRVESNIFHNWGFGSPDPLLADDNFSGRWETDIQVPESGVYNLRFRSDDGIRIILDGQILEEVWRVHGIDVHRLDVRLVQGKKHRLVVEYFEATGAAILEFGLTKYNAEEMLAEAVEKARRSDVVLLFAGLSANYEAEAFDRETLELPENQIHLIDSVLAANPNTILVLNSGSPVLLRDWPTKARAIVASWYLGQEGGNAIARVLSGLVNPSGKLPFTWIRSWEDHSAYGNYPGANGEVRYAEGILLGYRHAEKFHKTPLYPFGHGLSYSSFALRNPRVATEWDHNHGPRASISVELQNTSDRSGEEVVQVYVEDVDSSVVRPVKELKAFAKVELAAGERQTLSFTLDARSFAFFHPQTREWTVEPGQFRIHLGNSSGAIAHVVPLEITQKFTKRIP